MTLVRLQMEGFAERDVRRHSIPWLEQAAEEVQRTYRLRLADTLEVSTAAASLGNAENGQEAQNALKEMVGQLRGEDDEDVAYFMDPNAAPDMEAIRGSGMLQYQPAEPEQNGG